MCLCAPSQCWYLETAGGLRVKHDLKWIKIRSETWRCSMYRKSTCYTFGYFFGYVIFFKGLKPLCKILACHIYNVVSEIDESFVFIKTLVGKLYGVGASLSALNGDVIAGLLVWAPAVWRWELDCFNPDPLIPPLMPSFSLSPLLYLSVFSLIFIPFSFPHNTVKRANWPHRNISICGNVRPSREADPCRAGPGLFMHRSVGA